jgi:hypothetical protein
MTEPGSGKSLLSAAHPDQPRDFAGEGAGRDLAGERLTVDPGGSRAGLDADLIAAHEARDWRQLVALYSEAADTSEAAGDIDAACFYLTHAYVFALQTGDPRAADLHQRLKARGREE